jgi:hypothetical protein
MALSKTLFKTIPGFSGKLVAENVYFRVSSITGDKNVITVTVAGISIGMQVCVQDYCFEPDIKGENFIKQAYLYLKTLPEFSDAVDC